MANEQITRSEYHKRYRKTPHGAAACAWNRLTSRAGAKYGHRPCYALVEVRMTRAEFMAWAVPQYEVWFREHPDVAPSIDRIESEQHYQISNLQIIALDENRKKNRSHRNLHAPKGSHWCCRCQAFLPNDSFYRNAYRVTPNNPLGLMGYCKACHCKTGWDRVKAKQK